MADSALCLNCDYPVVCHGEVWRHMTSLANGTPILTRWCLDKGWYIWPTMDATPDSN
jgi:hypothetical protein